MRTLKLLAAACALLLASAAGAAASVVAKIDISSQTMNVYVNGALKHSWKVSTARRGYGTPTGTFRPQVLKRMHYSSKYNNSPMPHSIFFRGGYAIHGTGYVKQLGRPASHGCVRLAPGNAATLFSLVKAHGAGSTKIVITH
jgi:lipoprotein-anchoring transpeptidase ErfK/SrfK